MEGGCCDGFWTRHLMSVFSERAASLSVVFSCHVPGCHQWWTFGHQGVTVWMQELQDAAAALTSCQEGQRKASCSLISVIRVYPLRLQKLVITLNNPVTAVGNPNFLNLHIETGCRFHLTATHMNYLSRYQKQKAAFPSDEWARSKRDTVCLSECWIEDA